MSEVWTQWQGHVINGLFPLGRYLGCSDHGGVFLTHCAALGPSDVAIKLVPADHALAHQQLLRWERAGGLVHPHLLRLLQWGDCQLDGFPYLYVVMEYADQTLAQVLQRRALTDDEVREMLQPILDALAFMHGQELVQGQLSPSNILVVGDQLKLASDTIHRVGEGTIRAGTLTKFDPPEARGGSNSTAGDIWALGMCLFEALTLRAPSGWGERSEGVFLPPDFSPAFRDVVARCLNPRPHSRPSVTELDAWARGPATSSEPVVAAILPAAVSAIEPATPQPQRRIAAPPSDPETARLPSVAHSLSRRSFLLTAVLGAAVIFALSWISVRMLGSHGDRALPPAQESSPLRITDDGAPPVASDIPKLVDGASPPKSGRSDLLSSTVALHEVIPEVSPGAHRTIRGHIIVTVRIIVDPNGAVSAANADRSGGSRYFQRLAVEAARKWTFPSIDTQSRRTMQLRFDFGRDETTGRALGPQ